MVLDLGPARVHAAGDVPGELAGTALADDFDRGARRGVAPERLVLLRGATILSMDPRVGDLARGDLLIHGSRIEQIGEHVDAPSATVIDASGKVVLPGFCDPHIHAWQGQLGRIIPDHRDARPHATRNYYSVMHETFAPAFRPEDTYAGTLLTLLAALDGGITTVCDNSHNSRTMAHAEAAIQAIVDAGIRGIHAFGRPYHGEWDLDYPGGARQLRDAYVSSDDQLHGLRLYMRGGQPLEELTRVVRQARELDLWVSFDGGLGAHPVVELYEQGLLVGKETLNHGLGVPPERKRAMIDHGATVNLCPRIETQFRIGYLPYHEWVEAGLQPAISNDDPATYAIDMFREMQVLYAHERARAFAEAGQPPTPEVDDRQVTVADLLRAATLRGAENCGLADRVGSLTPGKQADVLLLDVDKVGLYPINNVYGTVGHGTGVGDVDTVFVAGRLAKWRGRLVGIDLAVVKRVADESRDHLFRVAGWPLDAVDLTP